MHECLVSLGVDSDNPPSKQVYVDTYQSAEQYYAFEPGFDAMGAGQMQATVTQCPPPTWFLDVSGLS